MKEVESGAKYMLDFKSPRQGLICLLAVSGSAAGRNSSPFQSHAENRWVKANKATLTAWRKAAGGKPVQAGELRKIPATRDAAPRRGGGGGVLAMTAVTSGFAAELPTYEKAGFPISAVQVQVLAGANVGEQSPVATSAASPHQLSVLIRDRISRPRLPHRAGPKPPVALFADRRAVIAV